MAKKCFTISTKHAQHSLRQNWVEAFSGREEAEKTFIDYILSIDGFSNGLLDFDGEPIETERNDAIYYQNNFCLSLKDSLPWSVGVGDATLTLEEF